MLISVDAVFYRDSSITSVMNITTNNNNNNNDDDDDFVNV